MIAATRRWFRRNRNTLLIGAGVIGAGYVAGQYVIGKLQETRQRIGEERVAKENLRRRFQQNQEDCRYTVLALLPTIREEIIGSLPVEQITEQLQHERQERLRRLGNSDAASSELPSGPPSVADDASLQGGSYVHASQVVGSETEGDKQGPLPRKSKAQLWQEMKINAITRALSLLYTISLLTLFTRIQLNLLGRRTYLSSVVALASQPTAMEASTISLVNKDDDNYDNVYGSDFETNRKYLTFSWWLLHRGSKQITQRVMAAVQQVFGAVNIREDLTLQRLAELIVQVRKNVEGATEEDRRRMQWLQYLLPRQEDESFVIRQAGSSDSEDSQSPEAHVIDDPMTATAIDAESITPSLRRLLDETADLVDSPTFAHVLTRLLDATFSHLVDYRIATEAFKADLPAPLEEEPRVVEVNETRCKLAHILPVFCNQAHVIAAGSGEFEELADAPDGASLPRNEYLDALEQVHDLEAFAAVIYSSNFDYEVAETSKTPIASDPHYPREEESATVQTVSTVPEINPAAPMEELPSAIEQPDNVIEYPVDGVPFEGVETTQNEDIPITTSLEDAGAFEAAWNKAVEGNETPSNGV